MTCSNRVDFVDNCVREELRAEFVSGIDAHAGCMVCMMQACTL
jgi:hypothetical protein